MWRSTLLGRFVGALAALVLVATACGGDGETIVDTATNAATDVVESVSSDEPEAPAEPAAAEPREPEQREEEQPAAPEEPAAAEEPREPEQREEEAAAAEEPAAEEPAAEEAPADETAAAPTSAVIIDPATLDPALIAAGADTYAQACARCHGEAGEGTQRGRPLAGIAAEQPDPAVHIVSVAEGKGNMPAFGERLSPEEVSAVVAWTRAEF